MQDKILLEKGRDFFSHPEKLPQGAVFVAGEISEGPDPKMLSDLFVEKFKKGVLLLLMKKKGKVSVFLRATKNLKEVQCHEILKEALYLLEGKGGGRKAMAQGSGKEGNRAQLDSFIGRVKTLTKSALS